MVVAAIGVLFVTTEQEDKTQHNEVRTCIALVLSGELENCC